LPGIAPIACSGWDPQLGLGPPVKLVLSEIQHQPN
jgi:hypothetical protein